MKKSLKATACRLMTWMLLGFCVLWRTEPIVAAQAGTKDSCNLIHDSYKATFAAGAQIAIKNAGVVDVTHAQGDITSDASYHEYCQYMRDETVDGETASVYSDVMKSRVGSANGKVWISKKTHLVLQQEVDVDLGAKGQGHQSMKFNYKKK